MMSTQIKRSAIHNLIITDCRNVFAEGEISEGLVIPEDIMFKSDILPWEQVIVTKIDGDNWVNRLSTFVIPGPLNGKVEARGSLCSFLKAGDLTCLISRTLLDQKEMNGFKKDKYWIFDVGFDPQENKDNLIRSRLDIEFLNSKKINIEDAEIAKYRENRKSVKRFFLSSLIQNLTINKTHPDCLQGSAELPKSVMDSVGLSKYQSVSVYNATKGGIAETYAVPMPEGVVMTTGAMAKFAGIGEKVNVATYVISDEPVLPRIAMTDGTSCIESATTQDSFELSH